MFITGLVIVVRGKIKLASELVLDGWRARLLGLVWVVLLPLNFMIGLFVGVLIGAGILPASARQASSAFDVLFTVGGLAFLPVIVLIAKPLAPPGAEPGSEKVRTQLAAGQTYLRQGRLAEAIAQFELAIRDCPRCAAAHIHLAAAYREQNDWPAVTRSLQAALELDPNNAAVHSALGEAYHQLGQDGLATREWEIALRIDPHNPEARQNLPQDLQQHLH